MNFSYRHDFALLRKKAEAKLRKLPKVLKQMTPEDILDVMHELHVYQIELEMQNEELMEAQHRIEQSYEKYSDLFDLAPSAYFILDRDGVILNVNYTGSNMLEIDKRHLVGKPLSLFLTGKNCQEDFFYHRGTVLETEGSQSFEVTMRRRDDTRFYAMIKSSVLKDEHGEFIHFRSVIIDMTKQKEQEKAIAYALKREQELGELKSRFLSMASHEFRTPLATILSSLYLIEKYNAYNVEEKRLKHIRKIRSSVQGLNEILNDFLSLEQIENGTIRNIPEVLNLAHFSKEIMEEIKQGNGHHHFVCRHKGRQEVFLDKKLLKICLSNLLSNAVKYSPNGKTIELLTEVRPEEITISVNDEGIGIPEEDQAQIFEQFFRAKNADAIQGTGLGLSIIKKLTLIMSGTIGFRSAENKGSSFTITLPSAETSASAHQTL